MKYLSLLTILSLSFNFSVCIAQVDSTLSDNPLINDFHPYFNNSFYNKVNLISFYQDNLFEKILIQESVFNDYRLLSDKIKNISTDFSKMIPKGNPVFSIQYALFYGLYSENRMLLKRWNCLE